MTTNIVNELTTVNNSSQPTSENVCYIDKKFVKSIIGTINYVINLIISIFVSLFKLLGLL